MILILLINKNVFYLDWFIVIEWVLTYLLFATPAGASNTFKVDSDYK